MCSPYQANALVAVFQRAYSPFDDGHPFAQILRLRQQPLDTPEGKCFQDLHDASMARLEGVLFH